MIGQVMKFSYLGVLKTSYDKLSEKISMQTIKVAAVLWAFRVLKTNEMKILRAISEEIIIKE